jgi:hypothetical protein
MFMGGEFGRLSTTIDTFYISRQLCNILGLEEHDIMRDAVRLGTLPIKYSSL